MSSRIAGESKLHPWLRDMDPETRQRVVRVILTPPRNKAQLQQWMWKVLGLWVSDAVHPDCAGKHRPPLDALWGAYSGQDARSVWKASRGLGGKTVMLAGLCLAENITLGAGVTLLGGTGEQSRRVHEYMSDDSSMQDTFWHAPLAPRHLLKGDPTQRHTRLHNGGWMSALMASSASVRGPHPERLRGDEIDEMDAGIWDSASGQPISRETKAGYHVRRQIVGSSTHHYANGTMTRELKMALERGWPIYEWCYKENLRREENPHGWLTEEMVQETKDTVTTAVWTTEYELQEPSVEGRAIETEAVDWMFSMLPGQSFPGKRGDELILEPYDPEGTYAVGGDWGKHRDRSIFVVLRTDVWPARIVAFFHLARMSYKKIIPKFNDLVETYQARACHDRGGIGTVIEDYLEVAAEGVNLQGAMRGTVFQDYILAIEQKQIQCPMIEYMYNEHKYVTTEDLTRSGKKYHPPDTFIGGALAWRAASQLGELVY